MILITAIASGFKNSHERIVYAIVGRQKGVCFLISFSNFGKFLALQIIHPFKAGQEFGERVFIRNNNCV